MLTSHQSSYSKPIALKGLRQMVAPRPLVSGRSALDYRGKMNVRQWFCGLFLAESAAPQETNEFARLIQHPNRADAVVLEQFVDAFDGGILRHKQLRVHGSHHFASTQAAPFLARDFLQIF